MKPKFDPAHFKLSVANLLATSRQEAVVHPYGYVRDRASEAAPMLKKALSLHEQDAKETIKALHRLNQPGIEPGEALAISILIDAINRSDLDTLSYIKTTEEARATYLRGLASASRMKNDAEVARWQWLRKALVDLEGASVKEVNLKTLWDVSALVLLKPL